MAKLDDEIEDPADSYNDAMAQAAKCMLFAQNFYEGAETENLGLAQVQVLLAKASYFQQRATAFYQFAALLGPHN